MVLEHLFPEDWLEKKVKYAFIIAVVYSVVGLFVARLILGSHSGLASVIYTSLLIMPYLQKMFANEENEEESESGFFILRPATWIAFFKNNQAIRIYFSIFAGIYLTYALESFLMPLLGFNSFDILKDQLLIDPSLRGRAFSFDMFLSIFANNWWVLLACFLLSTVIGNGAIFFIAWNASSWGTIFGYRAISAAAYSHANPWYYLFLILIITLPHVLFEAGAYIFAAISGNIISNEIIKERNDIRNFILFLMIGICAMFFLNYFYTGVLGFTSSMIFSLISICIIVPSIYIIKTLFQQKSLQRVFDSNYNIFILALIFFFIGVLIESLVLNYSGTLRNIYTYSSLFR